MSNIKTQIGKIIGKTLNSYHDRVKPKIDELKFKEEYQGRIIDCMVGEVDDNYIETPETDENIVKLEHSKEGVIKIPQIKGKTLTEQECKTRVTTYLNAGKITDEQAEELMLLVSEVYA